MVEELHGLEIGAGVAERPMSIQRKRLSRLIEKGLCALFLVAPPSLHTQTVTTGAITGILTDPSGAAIPGATVTAAEMATGATRTAKADASGSYRISLLPPGEYSLRF